MDILGATLQQGDISFDLVCFFEMLSRKQDW